MPKAAPIHLDVEAVLGIHAEVISAHGGGAGIRDRALLEAAVAAPQASFAGEPLISKTIDIGAAYLFHLCRNHSFVDGNKRTALAACLVFLQANGALPDPDLPAREVDAWEALVLDVAASREDRPGLTKRLKALLRRKAKG
ncbi:MAG: type II toxin-antitoxin system death-on-curing family toxin [Betaproteobacteria bacterium]|nr:type II toxin-antitoxin system death-on-curing family toxin [Betaproteobacteria bacterium]MBI2959797.1 type II toxin-antitoxin system death-on-curing family toxin [Betaproteobacteria bacterium]